MKYLVYILSVGSLIGSYYKIAPGISYEDIACVLLFIISLFNFIEHKWKVDRFCKLTALYIPFMILPALINGDLTNTVFINYFRNYTWGVVVYFALSNTLDSERDIKKLLLIGVAFFVVFALNFRMLMQSSFSENINTIDFEYGRNNVAFTALLFSLLFEFLYYSKLVKSYILLGIVLMIVIIVFSASRFSMMMLVISYLLFRILSHKKITWSEILTIVVLVIVGPLIYDYILSFVDSSFYENSQNFLNKKMNGALDDFWYTRIIGINVNPIKNAFSTDGALFLLMGKPLAVQHSFFSHSLITTGLAGWLIYLISNYKLLKWSYHYKGVYIFLFITILVMLTNDFITNARFIIGVNSVFYSSLCAIVYRYIVVNEHLNIS